MSNEKDSPKQWICRNEVREVRKGDWFFPIDNVAQVRCVSKGFDRREGSYSRHEGLIMEPIPDDVVMVPREKIERFRKYIDGTSPPPLGVTWIGEFRDAAMSIIACAEPAKPKDEILEAMRMMDSWVESGATFDVKRLKQAIALREKELKERGE